MRQSQQEPPVVHLHIGTMKSGTSYIQGMLWRNRELLHAHGVLYPGETWQDQVEAVRDVIEARGAQRRPDVSGSWDRMRDQLLAWSGARAVLSMELLSLAQPQRVAAVVESLAPAEVHAIITARDLARVVPSAWQESTQNRQTWTWPAYVASVTGESEAEPAASKRFWSQHDLAEIARTWSAALSPDRVHLVLVPPSGGPRDELWRRFCSVVGLDAAAYGGAENVRGNPAVGAASAEFLRRLNVEIGRDLDVAAYERLVKRFLAKSTLAHRTTESRLVLPARYGGWAHDRAAQMVAELRECGIDIVGDLDELIPTHSTASHSTASPSPASPSPSSEPLESTTVESEPESLQTSADADEQISEEEVADAGLHAVEALVLRLAQTTAGTDRPRRSAARSRR